MNIVFDAGVENKTFSIYSSSDKLKRDIHKRMAFENYASSNNGNVARESLIIVGLFKN